MEKQANSSTNEENSNHLKKSQDTDDREIVQIVELPSGGNAADIHEILAGMQNDAESWKQSVGSLIPGSVEDPTMGKASLAHVKVHQKRRQTKNSKAPPSWKQSTLDETTFRNYSKP